MAMAAMNMVSAGGFLGVSFHLRRFPQGVASVFCKKTPIFGSRGSKLDHLTVSLADGSSHSTCNHCLYVIAYKTVISFLRLNPGFMDGCRRYAFGESEILWKQ